MRPKKGFSFIFIILIGILTATSVYFYLKSQEKTPTSTTDISLTVTPTGTIVPTASISPTPAEQTIPAPATNRPSNPAATWKVKSGETLFMIGRRFDMTWSTLIAVNGIAESNANKVKQGQILIIPSYDSSKKIFSVNYKTDINKSKEIQTQANNNSSHKYLDPIQVAKSDIIPIYSITNKDDYILKSSNDYDGTATIEVIHNEITYIIELIQPITKGKKGIWAITKVYQK